jgi:hypothetical protein
MALNFPDSPFIGQIYSDVTAGFSYVWDGTVWKSYYQSDQTPDGTVTPPKLSPGGPVWNTGGDLNVTGILTAANISVAGTITYNDVTSVDSIGVVTARSGVVVVGGGVSIAGGGLRVSGVSTFQNGYKVTGGNSYYNDDVRLYFGNDSDIFIGHQTIPSPINYIAGDNNIPLTIWSDNLTLGAQNGENFATFTTNGSASLYYDNVKKFETLGTGVTVTGTTFTNQLSVSGFSTFTNNLSTIHQSGLNPGIRLNDTSGNTLLGMYYDTSSTQSYLIADQKNINIKVYSPQDVAILAGDETMASFESNGPVSLYYDNVKKFETLGTGVTVTGTTFTNQLSVSGVSTFSDIGVGGTLTIQQTTEVLNKKTGAGNTVTHDFSTGSIWYHSGISTDFILNLTNVPTTEDRAITVTLFLDQGGTGYYANGLQIDGATQTIRWANNVTPTPSTNKLDVQSFTLIRVNVGAGATWNVLGQLINYN